MKNEFAKRFSEPEPKAPQIRVANSAYRKLIAKRIAAILGYTLVGSFIVYLCLASTIMRAVPTMSGAGIVPVKENTFSGGAIPSGQFILADSLKEQKSGYVDRLKQAFIPSKNSMLLEVVAGPHASMSWVETGFVSVDGKLSNARLDVNPEKKRLSEEYLAVCISGACTPGAGVIVPKENIYGLAIKDYDTPSYTKPVKTPVTDIKDNK